MKLNNNTFKSTIAALLFLSNVMHTVQPPQCGLSITLPRTLKYYEKTWTTIHDKTAEFRKLHLDGLRGAHSHDKPDDSRLWVSVDPATNEIIAYLLITGSMQEVSSIVACEYCTQNDTGVPAKRPDYVLLTLLQLGLQTIRAQSEESKSKRFCMRFSGFLEQFQEFSPYLIETAPPHGHIPLDDMLNAITELLQRKAKSDGY